MATFTFTVFLGVTHNAPEGQLVVAQFMYFFLVGLQLASPDRFSKGSGGTFVLKVPLVSLQNAPSGTLRCNKLYQGQ